MYVNRLRRSIGELSGIEFDKFIDRLRDILKTEYGKEVKPSDLRQRVGEFVSGRKKPHIDYFEAYLLTIDSLTGGGALNTLKKGNVNMPNTWRQLLLSVTSDRPIPPQIVKHIEDEEILKQVKALFYNSITYCQHEHKDNFSANLHTHNNFLKIKEENH